MTPTAGPHIGRSVEPDRDPCVLLGGVDAGSCRHRRRHERSSLHERTNRTGYRSLSAARRNRFRSASERTHGDHLRWSRPEGVNGSATGELAARALPAVQLPARQRVFCRVEEDRVAADRQPASDLRRPGHQRFFPAVRVGVSDPNTDRYRPVRVPLDRLADVVICLHPTAPGRARSAARQHQPGRDRRRTDTGTR